MIFHTLRETLMNTLSYYVCRMGSTKSSIEQKATTHGLYLECHIQGHWVHGFGLNSLTWCGAVFQVQGWFLQSTITPPLMNRFIWARFRFPALAFKNCCLDRFGQGNRALHIALLNFEWTSKLPAYVWFLSCFKWRKNIGLLSISMTPSDGGRLQCLLDQHVQVHFVKWLDWWMKG